MDTDNHIKVVCRIRPANSKENTGLRSCLTVPANADNCLLLQTVKPENKQQFSFDYCANENVTQDEIFVKVGMPIIKSCVEGYNGTILCYGQTGS